MLIVVDENIPYAEEAFGRLGTVRKLPGRRIVRQDLEQADALIVRSITRVNADLLRDTPVRFVGTCTIGEDHVDKAWLAAQGIGFASAPGCNANSVADYITAALLFLEARHGITLRGASIGIVGVGNVGSRVARRAEALGMRVTLNDPPRAEREPDFPSESLEAALSRDFITFHVPLEKTGPWPTWHMVDAARLNQIRPETILLNTSRGAVVDNPALLRYLENGRLRGAVLDVWEGEPAPDPGLIRIVDLATPHIAGYSFDGKVNGTRQVYEALCRHLGVTPDWDPSPLLPPPDCPEVTVNPDDPDAIRKAVFAVYDIREDDARTRPLADMTDPAARGAAFDQLRKHYPRRREFINTTARLTRHDETVAVALRKLGFKVATAGSPHPETS